MWIVNVYFVTSSLSFFLLLFSSSSSSSCAFYCTCEAEASLRNLLLHETFWSSSNYNSSQYIGQVISTSNCRLVEYTISLEPASYLSLSLSPLLRLLFFLLKPAEAFHTVTDSPKKKFKASFKSSFLPPDLFSSPSSFVSLCFSSSLARVFFLCSTQCISSSSSFFSHSFL